MKYIGRISFLCISVAISIMEYIVGEEPTGRSLFQGVCMAGLSVWMGSAFDRARYFRKEAERSRQQVHTILESISDAFFTVDRNGRLIYVNGEAQAIMGKTAEELLGNSIWETFPDIKNYDFYQQIVQGQKDTAFELFYEPLTKWLAVRAYPSTEGTSVFFMDISEQKRAEAELVRVKNELDIMFKHSGVGIALTDLNGRVVRTNAFLQNMLGYSEEEISSLSVVHVTHPEDMQADWDMLQGAVQEKQPFYQLEKRYIKKNGDIFPAKLTVSIIRDEYGQPEYTIGIIEDITKQQEMMHALQQSEEMYRFITNSSTDVIAFIKPDGRYEYISPACHSLFQYHPEELIGKSVYEFLHPEQIAEIALLHLDRTDESSAATFTHQFLKKDTTYTWMETTARAIRNEEGELQGVIAVSRDATQRMEREKELRYLSLMDALTHIPNRRHFEEALDTEWQWALEYSTPLSVLMIDIDFFKGFNDMYGHQAGDGCIQQVAQALQSAIRRPRDLAARYGGEEFVVLLPEANENGAYIIGEKLRAAIQNLNIPTEASALAPYVTVSIGCATIIPDRKHTPKDLVGFADKALYTAKESGKDKVQSYCVRESAR